MLPPSSKREPSRSMVRSLRLLGALFVATAILLPLALKADPPGWWTSRGVTLSSAQANDYAAANQGQLKNIATQALAEMDASFTAANMPVNPADALHALVNGWTRPNASANNYAAVNLGQLKFVAQLFYDRFKAVNYTDRYPWTNPPAPANDYALANIGQVKNLFSFDFTQPGAGLDLDHNGLPDYWEMQYFGHTGVDPNAAVAWNNSLTLLQAFQQGLNPVDYYNGQPAIATVVSGDNQTGSPGAFVSLPLVVSVVDSSNNPFINAPVTFTVSQGGGQVQKSSSGAASATITVLTDVNGWAKVFFKLPNFPNNTNLIVASAGVGSQPNVATFHETSDGGGGSYHSPFAPTNFVSRASPDGSLDMTWENNRDDQTPIEIEIQQADGSWKLVATLPANTTSFHWSGPQAQ